MARSITLWANSAITLFKYGRRCKKLAKGFPPKELAEAAFGLYERFRPTVPEGVKGWGAKGELDLEVIEGLSKRKK